jgi:hypothetical protein
MLPVFLVWWDFNIRHRLRVRHTDDPYAYVLYIDVLHKRDRRSECGMIHDGMGQHMRNNRRIPYKYAITSRFWDPLLCLSKIIKTRYASMP